MRSLWLNDLHSRCVLITGCDTGFGNLLARNLDKRGVTVFAGCLTEQGVKELHEKCSSHLKAFRLDVTSDEDVQRAFDFVQGNLDAGQSRCLS